MKKILYVNGCSHAAGSEISYVNSCRTPNDLKNCWGGQIASRFNLVHCNDAQPGQGNEATLSNTLNSVTKLLKAHRPEEIFVIIGWSGFERTDFVYEGKHYTITAGMETLSNFKKLPLPVQQAWEVTINGSDPHYVMNRFSIIYFTLVSFLKHHGIDYLFFNAFSACYVPRENLLHKENNNEINLELFNTIKKDTNYINAFELDKCYVQYLIGNGFNAHKENRNFHFTKDGHTAWADYLESVILSQGKLIKPPLQSLDLGHYYSNIIDDNTTKNYSDYYPKGFINEALNVGEYVFFIHFQRAVELTDQYFEFSDVERFNYIMRIYDENNETINTIQLTPFYKNNTYTLPLDIITSVAPVNISKIELISHEPIDIKKFKIVKEPADKSIFALDLKIRFCSGIGDCLRYLAENTSMEDYYRRYGLTVYWTFVSEGPEYYSESIMKEIFKHCPYFTYVPENAFESVNYHQTYPGGKRTNYSTHFKNYFKNERIGITLNLPEEEEQSLLEIIESLKVKIVVQLSGSNANKEYQNYADLFKLLLEKYPTATLLLIDSPEKEVNNSLLIDHRVINLVGRLTITQCIHIIQRADYFIGPDSYAKYVCTWQDTKASILCSYNNTAVTPEQLLAYCFYGYNNSVGLCFNPKVNLLGVSYSGNKYRLSDVKFIKDINEITPEEITNSVNL